MKPCAKIRNELEFVPFSVGIMLCIRLVRLVSHVPYNVHLSTMNNTAFYIPSTRQEIKVIDHCLSIF